MPHRDTQKYTHPICIANSDPSSGSSERVGREREGEGSLLCSRKLGWNTVREIRSEKGTRAHSRQ